MLDWTGERYLPWLRGSGAEIHYEHLQRYGFAMQFAKGKRVLDMASGEGYGSFLLAREAHEVVGVDIDGASVRHARSRYLCQRPNLQFIEGSITAVPIEEAHGFDVVVCFEAIEHVEDHEALLAEVKRLLKPGGLFVLSTPDKYVYSDQPGYQNKFHLHELYFDEFDSLLRRNFQHLAILGQRVYVGAFTWALRGGDRDRGQELVVERRPAGYWFATDEQKQPRYFIGVASNAVLPAGLPTENRLLDVSNGFIEEFMELQINPQLEALQARLADGDQQVRSKEEQLATSRHDNQALQARLADGDRQVRSKEETLDAYRRESQALRARLADMDQQARSKEEKLRAEASEVKARVKEMETLNAEARRLEGELLQKQSQIENLSEQVRSRDEELHSQLVELRRTAQELAASYRTSSSMMATRSWRLTSPLRRFSRLMTRLGPSPLRITVDEPRLDAGHVFGVVTVSGWAAGPTQLVRVDVLCDGEQVATGDLGIARPDVAAAYPRLISAGFALDWDVRRVSDGPHTVTVRVVDSRGRVVEISGTVWRQVENKTTEETASRIRGTASVSPVPRIVYVSGWPESPSHVYRVDHRVEALRNSGIDAEWFPVNEVTLRQTAVVFADVVVLFRVAWSEDIAVVIERARKAGARIVYDIDDYVFDPAVANEKYVDGIRFIHAADVKQYHDGVRRYRDALLNADEVIFSTPYLAEQGSALDRPVHCLPNGFDRRKLAASEATIIARRKEEERGNSLRIGYASGTLTHQKDFAVAVPALARLMRERPEVVLTLQGQIDVSEFPELSLFAHRIELRPMVPFEQGPNELARFDVNLAPLEIGNPYCEAKSELKYYEAALVGVPTVASGTKTFREAIKHGVTGFLATTEEEWYRSLLALADDSRLRRRVASAARVHALVAYGPEAVRDETVPLLVAIAERGREAAAHFPTITFVLPGMARGSGGHRNIIMLAKGTARHGYRTILTFTSATADYPIPEALIDDFKLYEDGVRVVYSEEPICRSDATVATFWKTVYTVRDCSLDLGVKMHFVQDYEALFYAMGSEHIAAFNSLNQNFRLVTWGPWATELLASRHRVNAAVVPIPIDHTIYRVRDDIKRRKNVVVFFARPEMPRRCFELGVLALQQFQIKYGTDFEIVLFGSNRVPRDLPFQFKDLGILRPYELAELYATATVGLAFSPTNPSSVPYEMMACGLPVVDIDVPGNESNYGSRDNVMLAQPEEKTIADAVFTMLSNETLRDDIALNGLTRSRTFPSEEETIDIFVKILEDAIADHAESKTVMSRSEGAESSDDRETTVRPGQLSGGPQWPTQ